MVTTEALIARAPERIAAAVRAIARVQRVLRANPVRAALVEGRRFPPDAADLMSTRTPRIAGRIGSRRGQQTMRED